MFFKENLATKLFNNNKIVRIYIFDYKTNITKLLQSNGKGK